MLTLLKNAQLYAPEPRGLCHILIADRRIAAIIDARHTLGDTAFFDCVDLKGKRVIPGLVDPLVHYIGGGGEGGFANRTAELSLEEAQASGVTTLIGALGTDALTRTPANLIGKARELAAGGLSCFAYTGSYQLPPTTLTGSVARDIVFIPEFIGVGEVAISDHRGSQPTPQELIRLASEARTAGILANKAGIVFIHTGDAPSGLAPLRDAAAQSAIPLGQFYPTHINRTEALYADGLQFVQEGGRIDFTTSTTPELLDAGEVPAAKAVAMAHAAGIDMHRVSLSSDANASLPQFDEQGQFVGLRPGRIGSLFEAMADCIETHAVPVETALRCASTNAADALQLEGKGRIIEGGDADFIVINEQSWSIDQVWARGRQRYTAAH